MNDTIRYNKANIYFLCLNHSQQCIDPRRGRVYDARA